MRGFWTMLLAAGLTLAVGGAGVVADVAPDKPRKDEPKKEEPKADEAIALPWTHDEIKKAVKKGQTVLLKMEQTVGEKSMVSYTRMEITAVTDEGYTSKTTTLDENKKEAGQSKEKTEKWTEYMSKMDFKKSDTTVSEESVEVPAGKFDCKVYTQVKKQGRTNMTLKFYFPKDKPGVLAKVTGEGTGVKIVQTLEEMKAGEETK